jgi:transposase
LLPSEHLCWKIIDAVQQLDLSGFLAGYRADGQGASAYPPDVVLALVLYCYSKGIRSSRKIETACQDDIGARIITASQQIDHATIARFHRRHRQSLQSLFIQVLTLCGQQGLVDPSVIAIDGSPMHANAARSANRSLPYLEAILAQGEAELAELIESTPPAVPDTTQSLPPRPQSHTDLARLSRIGDRLARARIAMERLHARALPSEGEIRLKVEAAQRMVARAQHRLDTVTTAHQARLAAYHCRDQADRQTGRRRAVGRPPVPLDAKTVVLRQRARPARAQAWLQQAQNPRPIPSASARTSITDPDSRLMLSKKGGYLQGYNIQLASGRNQLLLAIEVHDNPNDIMALVPLVRAAQRNCEIAHVDGQVQAWVADAGYACTANFDALADVPLLVAITKNGVDGEQHDQVPIPDDHPEMAQRLATPEGQATYRRRAAPVEPGFAQLFQRSGRHLHYRGRANVNTEIKLLGTVHNLNKLFKHGNQSTT